MYRCIENEKKYNEYNDALEERVLTIVLTYQKVKTYSTLIKIYKKILIFVVYN
jgi:hypothetical protein